MSILVSLTDEEASGKSTPVITTNCNFFLLSELKRSIHDPNDPGSKNKLSASKTSSLDENEATQCTSYANSHVVVAASLSYSAMSNLGVCSKESNCKYSIAVVGCFADDENIDEGEYNDVWVIQLAETFSLSTVVDLSLHSLLLTGIQRRLYYLLS